MYKRQGITFVFVTHDQEEALTMSDRIAVMSQGVALQVGDANEIYEHPNCSFVADFIGDTNFLTGTIIEKEGPRVKVAVQGVADLWATTPNPISRGAAVSITVRPEKLHLRPEPGADNTLTGRVTSIVYIGTDTHYGVALPAGQEVRVRQQNDKADSRFLAQEGDEVTVYFAPEAARVLTE